MSEQDQSGPRVRRCRTRSNPAVCEQVTGLVKIVNGRPVDPGNWIVFGGKEGPIVVPPADFARYFELLPESTEDDPAGAMALARIVCDEAGESGALDIQALYFPKSGDPPEPEVVKVMADFGFSCIEKFMERVQTDIAPDAALDSQSANPIPSPPPVLPGGPQDVTVGYDAAQDRIMLTFAKTVLGLRLEPEKARALAMAIWTTAQKSPAGKNGVHRKDPGKGDAA